MKLRPFSGKSEMFWSFTKPPSELVVVFTIASFARNHNLLGRGTHFQRRIDHQLLSHVQGQSVCVAVLNPDFSTFTCSVPAERRECGKNHRRR